MSTFFALLFRLKYINRWGLMRSSRMENVAEHSLEVAFLTHALAEIGNTYFGRNYEAERLTVAALYHDVSEIFTGDMPSPIKYRTNEMREVYKEIECSALDSFLTKLPPELSEKFSNQIEPAGLEGLHLIHAADKLAAYIKCIEETDGGNPEFARAKREIHKSLDNSDVVELKYFIENFLPSFSLTVDDI